MDFIEQNLKSNNIDISDIEDLAHIFIMLGNQQEIKKIFGQIDHYLNNINSGYSFWRLDNRGEVSLSWVNDPNENKETVESKKTILTDFSRLKRPSFEIDDTIFAIIIPIISREETIGFFCLHKNIPIDERWKKIYIVVTMMSYIYGYYEIIDKNQELSDVDALTGLYNLKHFRMQIGLEVEKVKRFKKPLSIVAFRIKDYDVITQKLGFSGAEQVIKEFSRIFDSMSRKTDMPSRINNEMFVILLYETDAEGSKEFVRRIKNYLKEFKISVDNYQFNLEVDHQIVEYEQGMTAESFFEKVQNFNR